MCAVAGFESFETNSLEQLAINFANEKLQQHFNATVFTAALRDYESEGIPVGHIDFPDNGAQPRCRPWPVEAAAMGGRGCSYGR